VSEKEGKNEPQVVVVALICRLLAQEVNESGFANDYLLSLSKYIFDRV
jgi:hypothetical protein